MTKSTPRETSPRRWITLGAAASAVAVMGAGSAAAAPASLVPAGSTLSQLAPSASAVPLILVEGGEGGEGGEGAAPTGDEAIDFLADIAFIQGHAAAGVALYQAGETALGTVHIGHPIVEKYDAVADELQELGLDEVYDILVEMSAAAEAGADAATVVAAYDELAHELAEARDYVADPRAELAALVSLTKTAAEEYEASFEAGVLVDVKEYQDSWGFVTVIAGELARLTGSEDIAVAATAAQMQTYLAEAMDAYGTVSGEGDMQVDASIIYAAAARMEFALLAMKG